MAAGLTYLKAGVSVETGEELVRRIVPMAKRTRVPGVVAGVGGFSALFDLKPRGYRRPILVSSTDGVGTKLKIAFLTGVHDTVGIDLVAMSVNDILTQGAEPLFFLDYFACGKLDIAIAEAVVRGIAAGCRQAGCALLGGETAEMPSVYAPGEFDMAGFAVGVVEKSRMLDSDSVEAGDSIIGLASSGLHSNGYALVRRIVDKAGVSLSEIIPELQCTLADELLRPTRIYVKTVQNILARYKVKKIVKAMAHITGGGLPGNLPRVLPPGFSARLKRDAWIPHPIFHWLEQQGPVDIDEMFNVFNMGIGFVLIVRPAFTKPIMSRLRALGERPSFLGKVRRTGTAEPCIEWS
jgi:phosphoribosylformylglycinamidine cyclo-ligase